MCGLWIQDVIITCVKIRPCLVISTKVSKRWFKLGNNSKMLMMGKGNVMFMVNGLMHIFIEVFYVPEFRKNSLSIGQLQERGLAILI